MPASFVLALVYNWTERLVPQTRQQYRVVCKASDPKRNIDVNLRFRECTFRLPMLELVENTTRGSRTCCGKPFLYGGERLYGTRSQGATYQ